MSCLNGAAAPSDREMLAGLDGRDREREMLSQRLDLTCLDGKGMANGNRKDTEKGTWDDGGGCE